MENLPKIPGYKIERKIGEGATATVYLCIKEKLGCKRAVKVLKSGLINEKLYIHRFLKEARIAAKLEHQGIVKIYDVEQTPNLAYIEMEYLGESLKDKLSRGKRMPAEEALRIIKQVASALEYAHSNKVAHRDIKPANILFKKDGTPVLVDFGLALDEDPDITRTALGIPEGTGFYMSPEQCKGEKGSYASDFYSLGVVLFEMLNGEVPYKSDNFLAVVNMHVNHPIPLLPGRLSRYQSLIDQLMAKDKDRRMEGRKQVIEMIDRLTDKEEITKAPGPALDKTPPPLRPDKKRSIKKFIKKNKKILKTFLIASIIGFLLVLAVLGYKLYVEPLAVSELDHRGVIEFDPPGGEFTKELAVRLSRKEPLYKSGGNEVESEIYYTTDGSDPSKNNNESKIYSQLIPFDKEGTYTLKARFISKKEKIEGQIYSQTYIITSPPPVIQGGVIKFEPGGGNFSKEIAVTIAITQPLKTSGGDMIVAEIYYTLDGSEPTPTKGIKYIHGNPVVIDKEGEYTLKARLIAKVGTYEGQIYTQTYIITSIKPLEIMGGVIRCNPNSGTYTNQARVELSFEPLKTSKGDVIDSDIYYTLDGSEPTRTNGKKYNPGKPVELDKEGEYILKARLLSTAEEYKGPLQQSGIYIIKKSVPLSFEIETVTDVNQLDQKNIIDVLERIKEIKIDLSGIVKVNKTGLIRIKISISHEGEARLDEIPDFKAEPEAEFDKIKSTLYIGIQKIKFPPLTKMRKPVNAVLVTDFKKIMKLKGKYKFD